MFFEEMLDGGNDVLCLGLGKLDNLTALQHTPVGCKVRYGLELLSVFLGGGCGGSGSLGRSSSSGLGSGRGSLERRCSGGELLGTVLGKRLLARDDRNTGEIESLGESILISCDVHDQLMLKYGEREH